MKLHDQEIASAYAAMKFNRLTCKDKRFLPFCRLIPRNYLDFQVIRKQDNMKHKISFIWIIPDQNMKMKDENVPQLF